MSKRNIIIFVIILAVVGFLIFWFFSQEPASTPDQGGSSPRNILIWLNPFRRDQGPSETPEDAQEPGEVPSGGEFDGNSSLRPISSVPVAGFGIFNKERIKDVLFSGTTGEGDTTTTPSVSTEVALAVRYVDRANGNIYQTFIDKISEERFSKTVIPRAQEAFFGENAESVIVRSLNPDDRTIVSFGSILPKENINEVPVEKEIAGVFLPENITSLSISPEQNQIFYLLNVGELSVGTTSTFLGERKVQIFDSPFTEWLSEWPNENLVTLTTKPSGLVPGYMYVINPLRKDLNRILSNIYGLTTLTSPDGKMVLWGDSGVSLGIYNIENKETLNLGVRTLPEKCVWNDSSTTIYCAVPKLIESNLYPDSWYKGQVSFSDEIWKIDTTNGTANIVSDLVSGRGEEDIDGIKLKLDSEEKHLFFINKKDSFLWVLLLN